MSAVFTYFRKMLRFPVKHKARKFAKTFGPGSGPAEREKRLQMIVTALIRHERIEGNAGRLDETRQYAEQLINQAIIKGDTHKPTMELADHWLLEKDLVHKLFKVLAPRYANYETSFTSVYKLPREYPGKEHEDRVILELKGNPYPPVIYKQRNNENLLSNVLLRAVREDYRTGKISTATNYRTRKHLDKIDKVVNQFNETEQKPIETTENKEKEVT